MTHGLARTIVAGAIGALSPLSINRFAANGAGGTITLMESASNPTGQH
jgi:hypothetical protein